jgi:hypothetical protein
MTTAIGGHTARRRQGWTEHGSFRRDPAGFGEIKKIYTGYIDSCKVSTNKMFSVVENS